MNCYKVHVDLPRKDEPIWRNSNQGTPAISNMGKGAPGIAFQRHQYYLPLDDSGRW